MCNETAILKTKLNFTFMHTVESCSVGEGIHEY